MLHIFTLCYGYKFSIENVNKLYKQIKSKYKGKFTFYCYTDKEEKLAAGIKKVRLVRELHPEVREAWYKIDFFKKDFIKYKKGDTCISLDLDQDVINDPSPLFDMEVPKGQIGSLNKWWVLNPTCKLDGGFYKWHANTLTHVYDTFYEDTMSWMMKYWKAGIVTIPFFGEQNFVSEMVENHVEAEPHLAVRWKYEHRLDLNYEYFEISHGEMLRVDDKWSDKCVLVHNSRFIG